MNKYIHAFNLVPGVSYLSLRKIERYFKDWKYAWEKSSRKQLIRAGINNNVAKKVVELRSKLDPDNEAEKFAKINISLIGRGSDEYPSLFKQLADPPYLLYRKGSPLGKNLNFVAMVGTRIPSDYGKEYAYKISAEISKNGGIVVSGLAFGIDAICHYAAVSNGKPTIAVLASGINTITPASHIGLANKIMGKNGTVISEYAKTDFTYKYRFLERNRLISGMCRSTIIIEAKQKSGALITAKHAVDQNRDVYALVGDINRPQAQGCLKIIGKTAAMPITGIEKLLMDLGFDRKKQIARSLDLNSMAVLNQLKGLSFSTTELIERTGFSAQDIFRAISILEIKKLIIQNRYGQWMINKSILN